MVTAMLAGACQGEQDTPEQDAPEQDTSGQDAGPDHAQFRDAVVNFVRDVAVNGPNVVCTLSPTAEPPDVLVSMYAEGELLGLGASTEADLCQALSAATLRAVEMSGSDPSLVEAARFVIELTHYDYAMAEYEGTGVELAGGLVAVRELDRATLRRRIDEGTAYLLRVIDPEFGGVHKYYYANTDTFEDRLHTIYTASTIYTLLAVYAHDGDESLRQPIEHAANFLLNMQRIAPGQLGHGAFHYSFDLQHYQPEPRFVVGTTSKSIFTLIELHALTGEDVYLDAARMAADWLMTMQDVDGRVSSELVLRSDGTWEVIEDESLLYTGQVLSALSRLHEATDDAQYLDAASLTAERIVAKVEAEGCYLGDDYRDPNPVSSSWVILSLFDYARASGDSDVRNTVFKCADELLERQIDDPEDVYRHGRWEGSLTSCGNGWLAEVLSELYLDCPTGDSEGCARYHGAVVRLFRLLMQYTYSPENSYFAKNPDMARGGVFWDPIDREVRTDSVCHAMNAYVFMIDQMPDGVLVELPEPPLAERVELVGPWPDSQ